MMRRFPLILSVPLAALIFALMASGEPRSAFVKLADGFGYPVGKVGTVCTGEGYYVARGFRPNGHLGEDWNGNRGGDTDLGDPVYTIGNGAVVFAKDVRAGWGNVVIIRHNFRDPDGSIKTIDSLYGHLQAILVREGQTVKRGDQIGKIGNNRGMYDAHLHFEIHKNLGIGIDRASFARDYSNYYSPREFITSHQALKGGMGGYPMAMNTFTARPDRLLFAPVDDAKLSAGEARAMRAGYSRNKKTSSRLKKKRYSQVESGGFAG